MYGKAKNKFTFKPRNWRLQKLAGEYDGFALSCRHKDILRCSSTRHFSSCYTPGHVNEHMPFRLCTNPDVAILGEKDKSGDYKWRAIVRYHSWSDKIVVHKFYGNSPLLDEFSGYEYGYYRTRGQRLQDHIRRTLSAKVKIEFSDDDIW